MFRTVEMNVNDNRDSSEENQQYWARSGTRLASRQRGDSDRGSGIPLRAGGPQGGRGSATQQPRSDGRIGLGTQASYQRPGAPSAFSGEGFGKGQGGDAMRIQTLPPAYPTFGKGRPGFGGVFEAEPGDFRSERFGDDWEQVERIEEVRIPTRVADGMGPLRGLDGKYAVEPTLDSEGTPTQIKVI